MGIDIRLPVGILFALLGIILTVFGVASDPARYEQSLGININLYWGAVLIAFGAVVLLLARRGAARERARAAVESQAVGKTVSRSSSSSGH